MFLDVALGTNKVSNWIDDSDQYDEIIIYLLN